MVLTQKLVDWLIKEKDLAPDGSEDYYSFNAAKFLLDGSLSKETYTRLSVGEKDMTTPTAEKLFAGRGNIRVKDASEQYSEKRYTAKNKRGESVQNPFAGGSEVLSQSEGAKARSGALLKHLASKAGIQTAVLDEHERDLLNDLCETKEWAGKVGSEYHDSISGKGVKALIDDSTSGGLEIAPIEFDQDVVTFPLLNGELFPEVDLHPVPRGRRIEGASISNPTMNWGGGDDTSITPFNTASMVAALDTTIYTVDCAILIGRDFLSDAAVNVGGILTELLGMRLSAELDKVVGSGNGTTQPQGLSQASGLTTINPSAGITGPPTLADYMNMMFSVGKQYRTPQYRPCFVSNDTTFQRSRSIKIDTNSGSTDQRPVFDPGMSGQGEFVNRYATLGWPHKIQNDLPNGTAFFVALKKYRLYRRLGLEIQFYKDGATLAKANEVLLVARARYGGRLTDSSAAAKWITGQS